MYPKRVCSEMVRIPSARDRRGCIHRPGAVRSARVRHRSAGR